MSSRPGSTLFIEEGSLCGPLPEPLSGVLPSVVIEVKNGSPFPVWMGGILFAEEDSLLDVPDWVPVAYLRRHSAFPMLVG